MVTQIAPGIIRVQSILSGRSGLAEDKFVMTLHFRTPLAGSATGSDGAQAAHHGAAIAKVRQFWMDPVAPAVQTPRDYLSAAVDRSQDSIEIRSYHLGDPPPREPTFGSAHISTATPASSMPAEVAVCLSFSGARSSLARERGRIYFGPLSITAAQQTSSIGRVSVTQALQSVLTAAALRMAGGPESDLARWVVYSPTNNNSVLVRQGYVDDAFDTQRRRGEKPIGRTTFTVPS